MGEDGVVCVEREEERDKLEQEVETQCTQQNVTQVIRLDKCLDSSEISEDSHVLKKTLTLKRAK